MAAVALIVLSATDEPAPDTAALTQRTEWSELSSDVRLLTGGAGAVASEGNVHDIAWHEGLLEVDVTPNAGVDLTVTTLDATVHVVGTHFVVDKQLWGTEVAVDRGKVDVQCDNTPERVRITGGERWVCYVSAASGLGHAQALLAQGAPPLDVLHALDRAESHPAAHEAATVGIRAERLALLRGQVRKGDCSASLPWLDRLLDAGDPSAALPLVHCTASLRPDDVPATTARALALPLSADVRTAIEAFVATP
jgi:hypothetical protein